MSAPRIPASERFLKAIGPYDQVFVVAHDNPDPDAVASGWALAWLVQERLGKRARLLGGGDIVRAENRHMVKLLEPPIELVGELECPPDTAVVLVDCQSGNQNHVFCQGPVEPLAVVDHHPSRAGRPRPAFRDVRPKVAATASIAASYLREQKLEPGRKLATALLFAIRTETRGCETHYSRLDRAVLTWLTERADPSLLAEIESAPLTREYYGDLILALQNTFLYDDVALCLLPRASGPEIVGEVADLLIRSESTWRVFCGAVVHDDLILSVRTERDDDDAAELVRKTLDGIGQGGGHLHRAGGRISGTGPGPKITEDLQEQLRNRWLDACGVQNRRGVRLVPKREIVENL
jgi:nanoRNase/pAp phosphatase (c-di-AMP/oligoRNAs hydrolase)